MEPESIVVLIMATAFVGLCVWIERQSRKRHATSNAAQPSEGTLPMNDLPKD